MQQAQTRTHTYGWNSSDWCRAGGRAELVVEQRVTSQGRAIVTVGSGEWLYGKLLVWLLAP